MSFMKYLSLAILLSLFLTGTIWVNSTQAGISDSEARQLGDSLTSFGAEKAGNRAGTIPAYTGGLSVNDLPPDFQKGSGIFFANRDKK